MSGKEMFLVFKNELDKYTPEQLRHILEEGIWSIGQMYDHIILVAHEYLDNIELCATTDEAQGLGKTQSGEQLFRNGGFSPIKIKLPDEMNAPPNNSDSKEELRSRIEKLVERLNQWELKVDAIDPKYKVEHGGFGWLTAREWFDLIEMHTRHHLRQKEELEGYI